MKPIEKSIMEYFREYTSEQGQKRFLFDENHAYSVKEAYQESVSIANQLYARGIGQGSLVALRCTRSVDTALIYLALQMLGATTLLTDPHQGVVAFLTHAGADAEFAITNEGASDSLSAVGNWEVLGQGSLEIGFGTEREAILFTEKANLHSPATVIFTSGSTGKPKGVMLSQYNLVNHIRNFSVSGCYFEDDISIELLPLHHVFGLAVLLMGLIKRYTIFFPHTVSVSYAARCVEEYQITRMDGVPSFALAMAEHHKNFCFSVDSLRVGVLGGAPSTRAQFDFIEQELGIRLLPVYGQSECIGITGADETQSVDVRSSTVGKFLPMNQGFILNENGDTLPTGEEGEICVKGPAVMLGYLNDSQATSQTIDEDDRLHTGDLGWLDEDGNLHISGRKKDIIIRNGNNISARRIEDALLALPGVAAAAVVGVKHEKWGEMPCALVVLKNGYAQNAADLKHQLTTCLLKNEIPELIWFTDALPLTVSGKTDKQRIRAMFAQ